MGPPQAIVLAPGRHFLGDPDPELSAEGRPAVLVCSICAGWGCGFISARIDIGERAVTWSDFGTTNWEWGLDEWTINPIDAERFEFDRREYAAALGFDKI